MLAIVDTPVTDLIPYVNNARTHSDEQVAEIAASIKEFGWTNPVLVDGDNGIIAGHGRLMAARKLGMASVPAIQLTHLTDAQKKALVLADNKLALNAGWDLEVLKVELEALQLDDYDIGVIGFTQEELAAILADKTAGLTDEDDTPDVPEDAVAVEGDVWLLGKHRLACGDSTNALHVEQLLDGVQPHLMVTDPPYGVEYDPAWRNNVIGSKIKAGTDRATGKVLNDDKADWREAWALFPGDVAYVWHGGLHASTVQDSLMACDFTIRAQIVWAKNRLVPGRGHYHWQHEPCWYAVRGTGHWAGDRKQSTIWHIDKPQKSETGHGTQKPVECMRRPMLNNSSPGQAVYEPFSGSGTTIIAAETEARICLAMELSPAYVDVAIQRWQNFTGLDAVHAETGQTYEEMRNARRAA
jgi:DNA modification methylase